MKRFMSLKIVCCIFLLCIPSITLSVPRSAWQQRVDCLLSCFPCYRYKKTVSSTESHSSGEILLQSPSIVEMQSFGAKPTDITSHTATPDNILNRFYRQSANSPEEIVTQTTMTTSPAKRMIPPPSLYTPDDEYIVISPVRKK